MDTLVKKSVRQKKFLIQNFKEIRNTMQRSNLGIIEKGEETQINGTESVFKGIIEKSFPAEEKNAYKLTRN